MRRHFIVSAVVSLVAVMLAIAAYRGPSKRAPNLILVVIDCLRFDRVGWYGSRSGLTPFLDSLAEHGTLFWRAYAPSSWTKPSVASIFTGNLPSTHGVTDMRALLPDSERTLPLILKASGYETGSFTANSFLTRDFGFGTGFDTLEVIVDDQNRGKGLASEKGKAADVTQRLLSWVDQVSATGAGQPIMAYAHYMETHWFYSAPPETVEEMFRRHPDPARARETLGKMLFNPKLWQSADLDTVNAVSDLYDASVHQVDAELRKLFDGLRERGVLDNSVVVITADHGEELKEHGDLGHGRSLFETLIHVPLAVIVSWSAQRSDARDLVSLVDVAPTLWQLGGVDPPPSVAGQSFAQLLPAKSRSERLRRWLLPEPPRRKSVLSELISLGSAKENRRHVAAIIDGTRKVLRAPDGQTVVFDLEHDQDERSPLPASDGDRQRLDDALAARPTAARAPAAIAPPLDAETRERLRALGYEE